MSARPPKRSLSPPQAAPPSKSAKPNEDEEEEEEEEEEDYMSMSFAEEPVSKKHETLTQRARRLAREREIASRPKSKAQLAAEQRERLATSLITPEAEQTNKGLRMMKMMGYKPGSALGAGGDEKKAAEIPGEEERALRARLEPIAVEMKTGRAGIGAEEEKRKKLQEEAARAKEKKEREEAATDPGDYRVRVAAEKEEKRAEGLFYAAQKVCEKFDSKTEFGLEEEEIGKERTVPLSRIPVVWRGAVRWREERERERRRRQEMLSSTSRPEEIGGDLREMGDVDKVALGLEPPNLRGEAKKQVFEVELEGDGEEDPELAEFEEKSFTERLEIAVKYLREKHRYCFWCKYQYEDKGMEGCPGEDEESHG